MRNLCMAVIRRRATQVALVLVPLSLGAGQFAESSAGQPSSTAAALATAARFHDLLARGDSAGAALLLAPDAIILESGDLETRAEYVAHHLPEDIKFARSVATKRTVVNATRDGNVVWVTATSVSKGTFDGTPINSRGAELIVLSMTGRGWLIRAIHWSSRRVQKKK